MKEIDLATKHLLDIVEYNGREVRVTQMRYGEHLCNIAVIEGYIVSRREENGKIYETVEMVPSEERHSLALFVRKHFNLYAMV